MPAIHLTGKQPGYIPGRAYALITPATAEYPSRVKFGFAPDLSRFMVSSEAGDGKITEEQINEGIESLFDPMVNAVGIKMQDANLHVVSEAAWTLELDDLYQWYQAYSSDPMAYIKKPQTQDAGYEQWEKFETTVRTWAASFSNLAVAHEMLDMMIEFDRDLTAPGLVDQIHRQLDVEWI